MSQAKRRSQKSASQDVTLALKGLRERAGFTMAEMARELGYKGPSSYQRYEDPNLYRKDYLPFPLMKMLLLHLVGKGNPPITEDDIAPLGPMSMPEAGGGAAASPRHTMPIYGEVQAGVWKEVDDLGDERREGLPIAPLFSWTRRDQYALVVRGESMNKVARDGDYVICLDLMASGATPAPGDLVVVERSRDDGSIREVTVKRLAEEFDGTWLLLPESTDPKFQNPLPFTEAVSEDATVAIKAIVLLIISPQHYSAKEFLGTTT